MGLDVSLQAPCEGPSTSATVVPGTVVVAGSLNLDLVGHARSIPGPGQTVLGTELRQFHGGKGANQAVAAVRLGAAVRLFGAVGHDAAGNDLIQGLQHEGVDAEGVARVAGASGTALITVNQAGENAITVLPGANCAAPLPSANCLQGAALLVLQLEVPTEVNLAWSQAAREQGVPVLLNAAPMDGHAVQQLLPHVNLLVVNEGELAQLLDGNAQPDLRTALRAASSLGPATVVVTLGSQGCVVLHQSQYSAHAGLQVKVVDTTGAGDTFVGALASALAQGVALQQALPWANAAAALACTQAGARGGMPRPTQVQALLASP